jgi:hypothetical protein
MLELKKKKTNAIHAPTKRKTWIVTRIRNLYYRKLAISSKFSLGANQIDNPKVRLAFSAATVVIIALIKKLYRSFGQLSFSEVQAYQLYSLLLRHPDVHRYYFRGSNVAHLQ